MLIKINKGIQGTASVNFIHADLDEAEQIWIPLSLAYLLHARAVHPGSSSCVQLE